MLQNNPVIVASIDFLLVKLGIMTPILIFSSDFKFILHQNVISSKIKYSLAQSKFAVNWQFVFRVSRKYPWSKKSKFWYGPHITVSPNIHYFYHLCHFFTEIWYLENSSYVKKFPKQVYGFIYPLFNDTSLFSQFLWC